MKCKDCGKEFELSKDELAYFYKKGLQPPKRCKECRARNRKRREAEENRKAEIEMQKEREELKETLKTLSKSKPNIAAPIIVALIVLILIGSLLAGKLMHHVDVSDSVPSYELTSQIVTYSPEALETTTTTTEATTSVTTTKPHASSYSFRNADRLNEHFNKHGDETGSSSKEEYLQKANAVVSNPNSLSKTEQSENDGDTVYFLESTGELVILSKDGYIRTYFIADKAYFDRT